MKTNALKIKAARIQYNQYYLMCFGFLLLCTGLPFDISFAQGENGTDTAYIYFEHDKAKIAPSDTLLLREMKTKLFNSPNKILLIHGFADHTGDYEYNFHLSQRRAAAVVSYLEGMGVPVSLIESIRGRGSIERNIPKTQRVPKDRKVMVVLTNRSQPLKLDDFDLDSLQKGEKLILDQLQFKPGRSVLVKSSVPKVKKLLQILRDHPSLIIELQGHVCCAPKGRDGIDLDTKEENLSARRAEFIYEYLARNGIDSSRMTHKGFARRQPLYPLERNEKERRMNRRVEIKIVDF
ncbi:MAG: OmpA family protein [Bacteroidetes bacterium]|jgi:outer membrane protein OmpA-like peptidoglycan-associated protein|nr:OmpA family protein [Bacteroidota bacterium]